MHTPEQVEAMRQKRLRRFAPQMPKMPKPVSPAQMRPPTGRAIVRKAALRERFRGY